MIDLDAWQERAAIMEYDGGMSRFRAETLAAELQGATRWEAINAERERNSKQRGHNDPQMGGKQRQDNMPRVQRGAEQKARPMPQRNTQTGRDRLELLALRT